MESESDGLLEQLRDDRAALIRRLTPPVWYYPVFGLILLFITQLMYWLAVLDSTPVFIVGLTAMILLLAIEGALLGWWRRVSGARNFWPVGPATWSLWIALWPVLFAWVFGTAWLAIAQASAAWVLGYTLFGCAVYVLLGWYYDRVYARELAAKL